MDADDGCSLFAVDEAFWNLGSRRTLWRSERLPVGNGLRFHSLTSCRFAERHAFRRAPFRYPASDRAVLSNNFLEVGYNFLGLAVGPVRFVRGNSSTGGAARTASTIFSPGYKTKSQSACQIAVDMVEGCTKRSSLARHFRVESLTSDGASRLALVMHRGSCVPGEIRHDGRPIPNPRSRTGRCPA